MRTPDAEKLAIRTAGTKVKVQDFLDAPAYIAAVYREVKQSLDVYSYIRFAENLGFGKTNMLRLIAVGDRPLTVKAAQRIADGIDLHGDSRRYFTTLAAFTYERDQVERDRLLKLLMEYRQRTSPETLSEEQKEYFSAWYNPVVREMVSLPGFRPDAAWIRERMRIPLHLSEIKHCLEVLEKLGVVVRDPKSGLLKCKVKQLSTPMEVDSLAIIQFHHKMMDIAKESITYIPETEREITSLTVNLPKSHVTKIKQKIRVLLDDVELMEGSPEEEREVFQLNVQFFPFTKGDK